MLSKSGIETMDRTTPNHRNGAFLAPLVTFGMLLGVGTGGDYTPAYHAAREAKSILSKPRHETHRLAYAIAADIERIKSTLDVTMSELARCLSVSRQALYNWIAGGAIKDDNLARLNELKSAADIIAAASLSQHALLLRRKLPGGNTLLETVAAGGSGIDAARSLVEMVNTETGQKAALAKLFANRRSNNILGYGTPSLTDQS